MIDKVSTWTLDDVNQILEGLDANAPEPRDRAYISAVCFGSWNASIEAAIFKESNEHAIVQLTYLEEGEEDCPIACFDLESKDGKEYTCDGFDNAYRGAWQKEMKSNPSIGIVLGGKRFEKLTYASPHVTDEQIAARFLEYVGLTEVMQMLDLSLYDLTDVSINQLQRAVKDTIMSNENFLKDCVMSLYDHKTAKTILENRTQNCMERE